MSIKSLLSNLLTNPPTVIFFIILAIIPIVLAIVVSRYHYKNLTTRNEDDAKPSKTQQLIDQKSKLVSPIALITGGAFE